MKSELKTFILSGLAACVLANKTALADTGSDATACQGTDTGALAAKYDVKGQHYELGEGEICVDDHRYQFSVRAVQVPANPHFVTNQRIVVEVAKDLDAAHDWTGMHHVGWGELTAQLEMGDYLPNYLQVAASQGWENASYLGINTAGKGTEAYAVEGQLRSKATMQDVWQDVREIVDVLDDEGVIAPNVGQIGHSLGAEHALVSAEALNGYDGKYDTNTMTYFMGAMPQVLGAVRGKFLGAVRKHIVVGVAQAISGKGGIGLDEENYDRIMMSGQSKNSPGNWEHTVPDSARVFLSFAVSVQDELRDVVLAEGFEGTEHIVVEAELEGIIPDTMPRAWYAFLDGHGLNVQKVELEGSPHAVKMTMSAAEQEGLREVLEIAIPEKSGVCGTP